MVMRVLHMTPELPYETGGGGRGREFYLCKRLVELGHTVLNISPVVPGEVNWVEALREVGVENWIVERPASHMQEVAGAVRREPGVLGTALAWPVRALETRIFWMRLRECAERAVREWRPDVVVVGHDMAASWGCHIPPAIPGVLTLHNLNWRWYRSRAQRERPARAALLRAEAWRYRRYVLRQLPRYRAAVAVSTVEADELRRSSSIPISVIPSGVDTAALRPAPEPEGPSRVLFTGTLAYPPNAEGIRWFVDHVWPLVAEHVPGMRLDIVGRDPTREVTALGQREGVTVVGPVPDVAPYFARSNLVVVPVLTGAGIRVKIIEAMAAGRAVVSTSLGSEGLPSVEPGRHLLVADSPSAFASSVVGLLRDRAARRRIADDARLLAERQYDWRGLGDEQEALLSSVVEGARQGAPA